MSVKTVVEVSNDGKSWAQVLKLTSAIPTDPDFFAFLSMYRHVRIREVMEMDWEKYVGKRVLIKEGWERFATGANPTEVEVLEVSPSGKYVKFEYVNTGHIAWVAVDNVEFVECLNDA